MEKNKIIKYIESIGLTHRDAQYYIDNNYTLEQTIKEIEKINKQLDEFEI